MYEQSEQTMTEEEIVTKALQNITPTQQEIQDRTDKMLKLVFQGQKNFTQIAIELGVSRNQAYEYWRRWKDTEEASQVDWEWWNLYRKLKRKNPAKALECLTRIKYRMTTEKMELKAEIKEIRLSWDVPNTRSTDKVQTTPGPT
jgi:hypothetical protein